MTFSELNEFLQFNQHYHWQVDADKAEAFNKAAIDGSDPFDVVDAMYFRNANLEWYKEEESRSTKVSTSKMREMDIERLKFHVNRGLDVECITRITGYFAKTRSFNKGKEQELKDRVRFNGVQG